MRIAQNLKLVCLSACLVGLTFLTAACGSKSESSVNGMEASDFYRQFVSEKSIPDCSRQTTTTYTENSASGYVGNLHVTLKMTSDGAFRILRTSDSNEIWFGTWKVDKTELVLNGLARATGLSDNDRPALDIGFPTEIEVPNQLRGMIGRLRRNSTAYKCSRGW